MALHLVRHGHAHAQPGVAASSWLLSAAAIEPIAALRSSGILPDHAAWFVSPEPKAIQTADLLGPEGYEVIEDLREHERSALWLDDFEDRVVTALLQPDLPAVLGWEPTAVTRRRVVDAVRSITVRTMLRGFNDVVLVGHGTAWTLLVAALTDTAPDIDAWRAMAAPDHCVLDEAAVLVPWSQNRSPSPGDARL